MSGVMQERTKNREMQQQGWAIIRTDDRLVAIQIMFEGLWARPAGIGEARLEPIPTGEAKSSIPTRDSRLQAPDSSPDSALPTPDSRLKTPDSSSGSRVPTPDSRLWTPDSYLTQCEIDARQSGWEFRSNSTNAMMARVLRAPDNVLQIPSGLATR
jgi:hypothetical protein